MDNKQTKHQRSRNAFDSVPRKQFIAIFLRSYSSQFCNLFLIISWLFITTSLLRLPLLFSTAWVYIYCDESNCFDMFSIDNSWIPFEFSFPFASPPASSRSNSIFSISPATCWWGLSDRSSVTMCEEAKKVIIIDKLPLRTFVILSDKSC